MGFSTPKAVIYSRGIIAAAMPGASMEKTGGSVDILYKRLLYCASD
jgi:hypothetical protein